MNRTTPVPGFQGFPLVLRSSGSPEPCGAVFISLRVNSATSGRTGIFRVFFVFEEYTLHIIPRSVCSTSSAVIRANSQNGRRPVWIAAKRKFPKHSSVAS